MPRDLRQNVCGAAEAVESESLAVAGQHERPIADQAGAEQRRGLQIRVIRRQWKAEAMIRDGIFGIAAVDVVARKTRVVAEVFAPAAAIAANPAGPAQPGYAHPRAN